jgi:hypothetical protein
MKPDALNLCIPHTSINEHIDALAMLLPTRVGSCAIMPYCLDRALFVCGCGMTWKEADRRCLNTDYAFSVTVERDPDNKTDNWIVVNLLHWCGREACADRMRRMREYYYKRMGDLCQRNWGCGPRFCRVCGRTDDPTIDWYVSKKKLAACGFTKMKSCSVCQRAHYCSVECQLQDYPAHKSACVSQ